MKTCSKCKIEKPLDAFSKKASSKDGLRGYCKQCANDYENQRRAKNLTRYSGLSPQTIRDRVPEKTCGRCRATKPSTSFAVKRDTVSGLEAICKSCKSIEDRQTRERYKMHNEARNDAEIRGATEVKMCYSCAQPQSSQNFHINRLQKDGLSTVCKNCDARHGLEWARSNPERIRGYYRTYSKRNRDRLLEKNRAYRRRNPEWYRKVNRKAGAVRRARKYNAFVKDISREEIMERDGNCCAYCGVVAEKYEVEHIFPLSRGGLHTPDNLVLSCETCNDSKFVTDPAVWIGMRLEEGWWNIPSPAVLEALRMGYSDTKRHKVRMTNGEVILAA